MSEMTFSTEAPTKSALYLVDRGMQGKYYRYYNADIEFWGSCGSDMNDALNNKDRPSAVGFFPWVGPITGPKFVPEAPVYEVSDETKVKVTKSKKMARQRSGTVKPKLVITTVGKVRVGSIVTGSKTLHPDGTVFYRADRQKWVAMMNGKQEAARSTAEACVAFLKKKYDIEGIVLK